MEAKETKKERMPIMRAFITNSIGGEDYDFECVASPFENGQLNYNYEVGEYFYQVLNPSIESTRVERLDSGLPLFDNHPWDKKAESQLGISRGYEFSEEGIKLKIKLGARADEALRSDIKNGIVKTVSIEGDIFEYEITRKAGEIPVYTAIEWEPTSVSLAPVPQDIKSQIEVKRALKTQIEKSLIVDDPENDTFIHKLINKF